MSRDQITTPTPQVPGRPTVDRLADHLDHALDLADRLQDRIDAVRRIAAPVASGERRGIYAHDVAAEVLRIIDGTDGKVVA